MRRVVLRDATGAPDPERADRLAALLAKRVERLLRNRPERGLDKAGVLSLHGDGPTTGHGRKQALVLEAPAKPGQNGHKPAALGHGIEHTSLVVSDVAKEWLARGRGYRGEWAKSTRQRYEHVVRNHIEVSPDPGVPPLGMLSLSELTVDRVAEWSMTNERVLAPTTAVIALITLNLICRYALRRGWLTDNPVARLESAEKPRWNSKRVGILEGSALVKVLDQAGSYRPLFELVAFTGLRIGEALGLCWKDVDFDAGLLSVHCQLSRDRVHSRLKTEAANREVILAPAVVRLLRARWLASFHKSPESPIFCTQAGRGLDHSQVGDAFRHALRRAEIRGDGRLSLHSLRHGYASMLIAEGLDVAFVSRQLGHANPNVTLSVYAHLFAKANHAAAARQAIEAGYAAMARPGGRPPPSAATARTTK